MNNDTTPITDDYIAKNYNVRLFDAENFFEFTRSIERQLAKVTEQRDMLADLLRKSCAAHPVAGDWLEKSQEALADVKGGQHE